jgi:glutathione S-transferase
MSLTLFQHPLASFCHKVLLALYENETPFASRVVDLADPESSSELLAHWPVGKIPVLRDERRQRTIPETTIIIEYLAQHYPGPLALIPQDPELAREVRLWDRFFDCYVQVPMSKVVVDRLRPEGQNDAFGVREALALLGTAYDMLEQRLHSRGFMVGDTFTLADCAAAPALFYAHIVRPFAAQHEALSAYFERLYARASFKRVLAEARPYFSYFPLRDQMPARFLSA